MLLAGTQGSFIEALRFERADMPMLADWHLYRQDQGMIRPEQLLDRYRQRTLPLRVDQSSMLETRADRSIAAATFLDGEAYSPLPPGRVRDRERGGREMTA